MGMLDRLKTYALTSKPVVTAMARMRPSSGGQLYTEQATSKYNQFFDDLTRLETDDVLNEVGIQRHQLKMLLSDDEISEKIERRVDSLVQAGYTLSPSENDNALFIYDQLNTHLESLLLASMNAKLFGYSVTEIIWDKATHKATGKLVPLRLSEKPMQWFEPKNDGSLLFYPDDTNIPVKVDTHYKYILQQHRATYAQPRGVALLSPVYWLWFFKKNGWTFWSKFLERFGSPLLVGTTEGDTKEMASALAAAHNQSIFTMPEGDTVANIGATGSGESFKAYDEAINRRLAKYILGQTLTSGVDRGGTAGQGQIHERQQEIIFNGDKIFATRYVRAFIELICEMNGITDVPWFNFKPEKGIQDQLAKRDIMLTDQGVRFTQQYYEDTYDIQGKYIKEVGDPKRFSTPTPETKTVAQVLATSQYAKFDAEQQEIEDIATRMEAQNKQPLDSNAILALIKSAKDEDDMREKLFDMIGADLSESDFADMMATGLMVADIHGFCDESSGN